MTATNENRVFTPDNLEGEVLSGCKILHKIAIGGMGTIYKARQLSMNRDVAVKVLSDELSKDRAYVQRFILEARAAGELSHTNLIHVIDVGTYQNLYYYVMEYVDGEGLDAVLEKRGNLSPGDSVDVILQTAGALDHAHRKGIIHRDIKPDNIILMANGQIKLADLGIAKRVTTDAEGITQPGMVLGTPFYMAPEQGKDSRLVDRRSDIYALGASFYHMLSGKVPFDGKTCLEVVLKAIEAKPTPLLKVKENLPPRVVAICEKMMQKEPDDRYQTSQEVIQDLERVKAGLDPMLAPMPGSPLRAALPKSLSGSAVERAAPARPATASPRSPAAAAVPPASAQVNLFDVEELDVEGSQPASGSRRPPAPAAHPKPAAPPRSPSGANRAPQPPPRAPATAAGKLFEVDDLAVPTEDRETGADREASDVPARPIRDLDPDRARPRAPSRSGGSPSSRSSARKPAAEPEEDSGGHVPASIAGSHHGSINPGAASARTEEERKSQKFIPALTLGAALLVLAGGGIWLVKSGNSRGATDDRKLVPPSNTPVAVNVPTNAPLSSDTPESQTALESAESYAVQHPEALLQIIAGFEEVVRGYPTSSAADTARKHIDTHRKKFDDLCQGAFQGIEDELQKARPARAYAAVFEQIDAFRKARGTGTWLEKIDRLDKQVREEIQTHFDQTMAQARQHEGAGDFGEALTTLDGLLEIGLPAPQEQAEQAAAEIANSLRKALDSARDAFRRQYRDSETVRENVAQRRFKPMEEQLERYLKDPVMRPIRSEIELELESVRNARSFMDGVKHAFNSRVGTAEKVQLVKSLRQGKIVAMDDDKITLEISGRNLSAPVVEVVPEEIIRLGLIGLGARAEAHLFAAGFWQANGNLEAADAELRTASSMGGNIELAYESLERAQIRRKIESLPEPAGPLPYDAFELQDASCWSLEDPGEGAPTFTAVRGRSFANLSRTPGENYILSIRARKQSGLNGFLIGFALGGKHYMWAMGDDENTASWVRGCPETRSRDRVSAHRWYNLEIIVHQGRATGYVDGVRKWRITPKSGQGATTAESMGMGFVNTLVSYREVILTQLDR